MHHPPSNHLRSRLLRLQPRLSTRPQAPPLYWGMWALLQRHCSLRREDAAVVPAPPLSEGMWVAQFDLTEDLDGEDRKGGAQKVGGPCGTSRKWATTFVVACFLPSLQANSTKPRNDRYRQRRQTTLGCREPNTSIRQDEWSPTKAGTHRRVEPNNGDLKSTTASRIPGRWSPSPPTQPLQKPKPPRWNMPLYPVRLVLGYGYKLVLFSRSVSMVSLTVQYLSELHLWWADRS